MASNVRRREFLKFSGAGLAVLMPALLYTLCPALANPQLLNKMETSYPLR